MTLAKDIENRADLKKIKKAIANAQTRKANEREQEFDKLCLDFCKLVINKQLANKDKVNKRLDLSDKLVVETLNCTPRQAKRIREKLSKLEIIFAPEDYKQKKPGDYPVWLLSFEYSTVEYPEKKSTKKQKPVEDRYKPEYCDIYHAIKKEVFEISPDHWKIGFKMATIHMLVNEELAMKGLTRDDLRI